MFQTMMGPYVNDPEMGPKWDYVKEAVDAYFACTDCRDFVNDILELKSRSSGLFNSGWDFRDRLHRTQRTYFFQIMYC